MVKNKWLKSFLFLLFLTVQLQAETDSARVYWSGSTENKELNLLQEMLLDSGRFAFVADTSQADYVFSIRKQGEYINLRIINEFTGDMVKVYNFTLSQKYSLENVVSALTTDFSRKKKKIIKVYDDRILVEKGRDQFYRGQLFQLRTVKDEVVEPKSGRSLGLLYELENIYSVANIYDFFLELVPVKKGAYRVKVGDYVEVR